MTDDPIAHARQLYNTAWWGAGYFDVNAQGHVQVTPTRDPADGAIDMAALAERLDEAGLTLPVLVRFNGILRDRVDSLCGAFDRAIDEQGYGNRYTAVYPIKVNQQRSVVREIVGHGDGRVGLEAGSKPELMAVLAVTPPGGTIVCNGYKDREYLRLALIGRAMGHRVYVVVEKLSELDELLDESRALGIDPLIGMRVRLSSVGAGKWQNTGGEKGKFGLSSVQLLEASRRLRDAGMGEHLKLLHVHLGSQIANLRDISRGVHEAARYYVELARQGHPLEVMDVGGGLGVDYEGTRSRSACSMNYSLDQYAAAIVKQLALACREAGIAEPEIISESGRALTAHHAVLISDVIDIERQPEERPQPPGGDDHETAHELWAVLENASDGPPMECYEDAAYWYAEAQQAFGAGALDLEGRARAEQLYQHVCQLVRDRLDPSNRAHRGLLDELDEKLADRFFCNFSLFQSLPDVWALDQIFPIMPLDHLEQPPSRRALIKDLTCDSDGRIDRYVDSDGVDNTLPLHAWSAEERYLIGFFMVGAYQEILGDMHNLFGDTDSVNAELDGDGGFTLSDARSGDSASAMLAAVGFEDDALLAAYREKLSHADLSGEQRVAYMDALEAGLSGYTYLED